jgi:pSer/pThr/pTyr-binding forkhead associated (FHA) protein
LRGSAGQFSIRDKGEVRAGRDPSRCPIHLADARVSGQHASLKFEDQALWVRDDGSNNGTFIGGTRIPSGEWVEVARQSVLRFGPLEFNVEFEL